MIATNEGELIQELVLANTYAISINIILNKIYPYPVGARINQKAIVQCKQQKLTAGLKKVLQFSYKIFS